MKYERIIINFDEACTIGCRFCYLPTRGVPPDFTMLHRALLRARDLGFSVVTFSGGDPFDYRGFRTLLSEAKDCGFEVHVDTNGVGLDRKDYELLGRAVSLLGLPLDSSNAVLHDNIRGRKGHFAEVMAHVSALQMCSVRLKINTVVVKANLGDVPLLMTILKDLEIDAWSIFQFMPIGAGAVNAQEFDISDSEFECLVRAIRGRASTFRLEPGGCKERHGGYLFLSLDGSVYTHSRRFGEGYLDLGSFFGEEWQEPFARLNTTTIMPGTRDRYLALREGVTDIR